MIVISSVLHYNLTMQMKGIAGRTRSSTTRKLLDEVLDCTSLDDVIVIQQHTERVDEDQRKTKFKRQKEIANGDSGTIKRRKSYGLDILIDDNANEKSSCVAPAQRTRSHYRKINKILKLGTLSKPICLDEEENLISLSESDHDSCGVSGLFDDDDDDDDDEEEECSSGDDSEREGKERKRQVNDSKVFKVLRDSVYGKESNLNVDLPLKFSSLGKEKSVYETEIDQLWDEMASVLQEGSGSVQENSSGGSRECVHGQRGARGDELNAKKDLLPLVFGFQKEKPKPAEKSKEEKELDALWLEMDYCIALIAQDNQVQNNADSDHDQYPTGEVTQVTLCRQGKHDLILDEQIGLICICCSHIQVHIRDYSPPVIENPRGKSNRRDSYTLDHVNHSVIKELQHGVGGHDDDHNPSDYTGTVWDIIPGIKKTMYPHQCEAFEFLWSNLAGGILLDKLKEQKEFPGASGCLVSHAPGTGKTRLTIVFLQTYMELYPTCRPIIIAPTGILRTWEEEFKTWKVDIPFYNLNNSDYSGKESEVAMNLIKNVSSNAAKSYCRLVKLYSWKYNKSILGISYKLFEHLTREGSDERELLLEHPGLLVLDEGHTARNSRSFILKAVSEVQTKKRIILSGTPFQNNFEELYNTLCLARPKFAEWNPSGGKDVFDDKRGNPRNESKGKWVSLANSLGKVTDDSERFKISEEIRNMILPFVHVHQGTILQESLPGLRKLVIILKPTQLQKEVFEDIQKKRKSFAWDVLKLEYEESVTAIHPALFGLSECNKFERFRLNPEEGVKTKFVMELIRLSGLVKEKVLVFSQYIDPLKLLASQLKYHFGWNEGREVLQMHGKVDAKQRQASIRDFNDPSGKVKVMLASTKACYEGISLVGASRVVLLDVVWNPSVERQAISRAYRLGQKKFVYTYHLITAGTRDEEKCCRQAQKDHLSQLVFFNSDGAQHCQNFSSAELEDQILEDMIQHEKFGHIFEKVAINYQETNSTLKRDFFSLLV